MHPNERPTLRIQGPVDLLSTIPYLLGFQPVESLVLIGLTHGVLVVTARVDLAEAVEHKELINDSVATMVRGGSTQFVSAIFTDALPADGATRPYAALATTIEQIVDDMDADVLDCLVVGNGIWLSYMCVNPQCCPSSGRAMPESPTPAAAAATVAGMTVVPSREDLQMRFSPAAHCEEVRAFVDEEERALDSVSVNGLLGLRGEKAIRLIRTAMGHAENGRYIKLEVSELGKAGAALRNRVIRDAIWLAIEEGHTEADELWLDLARRLPSPYDAAPLFLYGWSVWRRGNGTLAGMAAERALRSDPEYNSARLLTAMLACGLSPSAVPPVTR